MPSLISDHISIMTPIILGYILFGILELYFQNCPPHLNPCSYFKRNHIFT